MQTAEQLASAGVGRAASEKEKDERSGYNGVCQQAVCSLVRLCIRTCGCHEMYATTALYKLEKLNEIRLIEYSLHKTKFGFATGQTEYHICTVRC